MAARLVRLLSPGMKQMLNESWVRATVRERAERVAATARATAPVESGRYKNGIHVIDVTTDRAVSRVVADVEHGAVVEANTGNLARALGSAR